MYKILVLNPGSTSTKVAYYEDSVNVCEQNLAVDRKVISGMKNIFDQMDLRKETIQKFELYRLSGWRRRKSAGWRLHHR